jgi:ABC-2 type transport system permease protein
MMLLSVASIFVMTLGIAGLGVGMGALYPRFHVENAAQISVSYGGVIYMVLSMTFIAVSVVLLLTPTSAIFTAQVKGEPVTYFIWGSLGVAFLVVTVLSAVVMYLPMRLGIKSLETLET